MVYGIGGAKVGKKWARWGVLEAENWGFEWKKRRKCWILGYMSKKEGIYYFIIVYLIVIVFVKEAVTLICEIVRKYKSCRPIGDTKQILCNLI